MNWSDLEAMVDEIHLKGNPALRTAIRNALDSGVSLAQVRERWGLEGKRVSMTACAVEAIMAEWPREVDAIAAELLKPKAVPCPKCDPPDAVGLCQRPEDCLGMKDQPKGSDQGTRRKNVDTPATRGTRKNGRRFR
jgi:hypothetical protein